MKSRFNKVRKASDTPEKIAPNKGIGKLSDNPKLKELLEKYGNKKDEEDKESKGSNESNDVVNSGKAD